MKEILLEIYNNFLDYYYSYNWDQIIHVLKIISAIFSILFIFFISIILFKIRGNIKKGLLTITENIAKPNALKKELDKKWQTIIDKLEKDNESDYKLAIIEADNILDNTLIKKGFIGDDMGERLKQINNQQIPNLDDVWQAHKLRNRIAHESDIRITKRQAEQVIESYKRAVEDLEVL